MSKIAKVSKTALVLVLVVGGAASTAVFAGSKRHWAAERGHVAALLRLMDADHNGRVSKQEFIQYMSNICRPNSTAST